MTAAHFTAVCIALIFGAFAAIILLITHAMAADRTHIRHGRIPLQPLPPEGSDAICPWCEIRECGNPRLCTCEELCGMPLCRPMETETAP